MCSKKSDRSGDIFLRQCFHAEDYTGFGINYEDAMRWKEHEVAAMDYIGPMVPLKYTIGYPIMFKNVLRVILITIVTLTGAGWQPASQPVEPLTSSESEENISNGQYASEAGENSRPPDVYIPLERESELDLFSIYHFDNISFVKDQSAGRKVQRVRIPEDEHYGMAMEYYFEGAEEVYMRWKQYLPEHWSPETGTHIKFPGLGNRDRHGWGGRQTDGTGGWSVRTGLRSHPDQDDAVTVEFYVYHMDMGTWGTIYQWDRDDQGAVVYRDEWTDMEIYVHVNTPGVYDGIIKGWVNGDLRFEKSDIRFRDEGYEQYDVQEIIWHIYHGGSSKSPIDQYIHFRDLKIWIGDMSP